MPLCEMCGSDSELYKTEIEGTELNLCQKCAKYGRVISPIKSEIREKKITKTQPAKIPPFSENEVIQVIVEDYGNKIKSARESIGLSHKDFAKKINEKESLIHQIEIETIEPNIDLARKLERFLNIKLIEQHEESHQTANKAKSDTLTIGDLVKIKQR